MAETELSILVKLKDEAEAGMKRLVGNFEAATNASKTLAVGLGVVGGAFIAFGVSSVNAAAGAQAEMAKFDNIMQNSKGTTEAVKQKILEAANAATKLGFDDETASLSMAKLFQRTGDLNKAMNLNSVAMDLARAKHMDLSQASDLVGMVLSGNGRLLKQYGIDLKEGATPMEGIIELQTKLKGNAESYSKTFQGQMEVLNVAFGNFRENVGAALLPILAKLLNHITDIVVKLMDWASNLGSVTKFIQEHRFAILLAVGAIVGALVPAFISFAVTLVTVTIPALAATAVAMAPFIIGGLVVAGIVAGIYWIVENWGKISEVIGSIMLSIQQKIALIRKYWIEGIQALKDFTTSIFDAIKDKIDSVVGWIQDKINALKSAYNSVVSIGKSLGADFNAGIKELTGARASGGPVSAGGTYLVGERGPELFTPLVGGNITSNAGLGGAINVVVTGNTISDAVDVGRLADKVGEAIMDKMRIAGRLAI